MDTFLIQDTVYRSEKMNQSLQNDSHLKKKKKKKTPH